MKIAVRGKSRTFVDGLVSGIFHTCDMEFVTASWIANAMHIRSTIDDSRILVVKHFRTLASEARTSAGLVTGLQMAEGPKETGDQDTSHESEFYQQTSHQETIHEPHPLASSFQIPLSLSGVVLSITSTVQHMT